MAEPQLPETFDQMAVDMMWILCDGWTVVRGIHAVGFQLRHRCGSSFDVREGAYLAEMITGPVSDHRRDGCGP